MLSQRDQSLRIAYLFRTRNTQSNYDALIFFKSILPVFFFDCHELFMDFRIFFAYICARNVSFLILGIFHIYQGCGSANLLLICCIIGRYGEKDLSTLHFSVVGTSSFMPYSWQRAIYNFQFDIKEQANTNIDISINLNYY